jgi:ribulose-5-phosphate 4-epimerase/fuculose-1-phosphate aldolase
LQTYPLAISTTSNLSRRGSDSERKKNRNGEFMSDLQTALINLVTANQILAHEQVIDGFGHISIRHPERPDRFFLSRSRSPELVTLDDLMEFDLDCNPIDQRGRSMYGERPIHGAIYQARPDVGAVVHHHAHPILPFTFTKEKLRPVYHMAAAMGSDVPLWDFQGAFGDTNMLVTTMEQGHDLARSLGSASAALMRGHGCVVVGGSIQQAVFVSIFMVDNAKLQTLGHQFGAMTYLTEGEVRMSGELINLPVAMQRSWEYWSRRSGAGAS